MFEPKIPRKYYFLKDTPVGVGISQKKGTSAQQHRETTFANRWVDCLPDKNTFVLYFALQSERRIHAKKVSAFQNERWEVFSFCGVNRY
jgi:hypothetical protein